MADERQYQPGHPPPGQSWSSGEVNRQPERISFSLIAEGEPWRPTDTVWTVPVVPSQPQDGAETHLRQMADSSDLVAKQATQSATTQGQLIQSDAWDLLNSSMVPDQLQPSILFGADFHWNFDPSSDNAAGVWARMTQAQSWLDTAEGWNAMLRPESPILTEGDLSVDSHAKQYIPRTPSVLSANLTEYIERDGRKYHAYHEGKYLLPNDEKEQDRLDLQHATYTMLFHGQLTLAPITSPKKVLDIATGTGIWAVQFAEKYPQAMVIGTDLSPIQPNSKPPNCRFWVVDSEDPWYFDVPFDYIHARLVCSCFNDPRVVIQQAYDNLEPGGWLEFQDADTMMHCDDHTFSGTGLHRLCDLFDQSTMALGRNTRVAQFYKSWMREIGFESVVERKFKLPGNTWPKDPYAKRIGLYQAANGKDAIDAISKALKRGLDITEADREALAEQAKDDCSNPAIHWYTKVYVVYGQKPLTPTTVASDVASLAGIGASFC